jgi:hypothetical protein
MKPMLFLAVSMVLVTHPGRADYIYDAQSATTWTYVDTHTIILNAGGRPYALVKMPFCFIYRSSALSVLTDDLGPYDGKILVDGEVCEPNTVNRI